MRQADRYPLPFVIPSLGPQKKMDIHQKSTKSTYQTLAMRTSRPQEDDS